jgi:uncharacterized protein YgiM (DUF1202 family)
MKKSVNSCNFRRQFLVLSTAVACVALGSAATVRADSGATIQPVAAPDTATGRGVVKGEHSNIRSRPSLHSEVITQLHKGDSVDVLEHKTVTEHEKSMDWVRISLPATAKCYVSAKHLADGTVTVENLNVRCGPGATYRDIGKLAKGSKVEILEKKGGWVQIKPPAECSGWINAELVDLQAAPAPPVVVPMPEPPASSGEIVTPAVAAPTGPSVSVVNTDPDVLETYAVKDGYLNSVSESNAPQAFELRTAEEDRLSFRMAYLEASGINLKKFDGKHVRIVGTQRWRKGERYPVITIERIDIVW